MDDPSYEHDGECEGFIDGQSSDLTDDSSSEFSSDLTDDSSAEFMDDPSSNQVQEETDSLIGSPSGSSDNVPPLERGGYQTIIYK